MLTLVPTGRIEVWDVPPKTPFRTIFAWSLPLPGLILLVSEYRHRRRRKRAMRKAGAAPT